tara:strand:+ start:5907 stop:6197 length:291 start_codon:yes stop_codon:yes gene_type:complete
MEITKERLQELEQSEAKLNALEIGGVDNWEWYGEAMQEYEKTLQAEQDIEDLFCDIETVLCEGSYEVSERGAGVAFNDDAVDKAKELLKTYLKELK